MMEVVTLTSVIDAGRTHTPGSYPGLHLEDSLPKRGEESVRDRGEERRGEERRGVERKGGEFVPPSEG
jgi:hypothetical protein